MVEGGSQLPLWLDARRCSTRALRELEPAGAGVKSAFTCRGECGRPYVRGVGAEMETEERGTRRWIIWVVVGALALIAVALWLGVAATTRDSAPPAATESGVETEPGTAPGTEESNGATETPLEDGDPDADAEPTDPPREIGIDPQRARPTTTPAVASDSTDKAGSELEPVPPEAVVEAPGGLEVTLVTLEAVEGKAVAGGEISGPAVRATVSIMNKGTEATDLEYVVVNAYTGSDRAPTGTVMQPGGAPFSGSLDPGETSEGVYLFSIAEADRSDVVITVDHRLGQPVVVFQGDLS